MVDATAVVYNAMQPGQTSWKLADAIPAAALFSKLELLDSETQSKISLDRERIRSSLFNLFFAFDVVDNRRAQSTLTLDFFLTPRSLIWLEIILSN